MMNDAVGANDQPPGGAPAWKKIIAKYQQPSIWRSVWQIVNSLVPYAALWYLMYLAQAISLWLALPLAILAGAFIMRLLAIWIGVGRAIYGPSRSRNTWRHPAGSDLRIGWRATQRCCSYLL